VDLLPPTHRNLQRIRRKA
jgi:hypothetical protein